MLYLGANNRCKVIIYQYIEFVVVKLTKISPHYKK